MCSLAAMPADYEMLLSHSPPVFSHSPPLTPSFLAGDYSPAAATATATACGQCDRPAAFLPLSPLAARRALYPRTPSPRLLIAPSPSPSSPRARFLPPAAPSPTSPSSPEMPVASPRRPCLVVRPEEAASGDEVGSDPPSPTRLKKKVVFADDKGLALTQVRVMTEPSNVPPMWSPQFLEQVTRGVSAEVAPDPWEVTFSQPASDYLDFRHRLDTDYVSLENVIVKESEEAVVGTVKVRNLSFEKEVLVRSSADCWSTQEDAFCVYVNNSNTSVAAAVAATSAAASAYIMYDTFSFRLTLPPRSRRIEFCVCFRCDGREYWDNNSGRNYVIVKKSASGPGAGAPPDVATPRALPYVDPKLAGKFRDAVYAKLDAWSEFASWNHLVNDSPYW